MNGAFSIGPGVVARRLLAVALAVFGLSVATAKEVTPLSDDPACTAEDRKFMARAIELAVAASARGDPSYGALLVKDGQILMEYSATVRTSGDPTRHAETGLVSAVTRRYGLKAAADCTLYTSTEPCIMCCGAIKTSGVKRVVYGVTAAQVTRLRGMPVPSRALQCREVFQRYGGENMIINGPLMEAEGLAVHAAALSKASKS